MRLPFFTRGPKYFLAAEYWLYMPYSKLPPQAAYLNRMMNMNPFEPGKPPPCGPEEGLVFSDIRFHMGLVLREKNIHVFRPDLFEPHVEPFPEALSTLADCNAMVKLRYISEQPVHDLRHLSFLVYLLEAISNLTRGTIAFDSISERLFRVEDLRDQLRQDENARRQDLHLRTIWTRLPQGGQVETRGLRKVGVPELETLPVSEDHQVLATAIIDAAADQLWASRTLVETLKVQAFEDEFELVFKHSRNGPSQVRILRLHSAKA